MQETLSFASTRFLLYFQNIIPTLHVTPIVESTAICNKLAFIKSLLSNLLSHVLTLHEKATSSYFNDELVILTSISDTLNNDNMKRFIDICRTAPADLTESDYRSDFNRYVVREVVSLVDCYDILTKTCHSCIDDLSAMVNQLYNIANIWNRFIEEVKSTLTSTPELIKEAIEYTSNSNDPLKTCKDIIEWVRRHFHHITMVECRMMVIKAAASDNHPDGTSCTPITDNERALFGADDQHIHTARRIIANMKELLPPGIIAKSERKKETPLAPSDIIVALHSVLCPKAQVLTFRNYLVEHCKRVRIPSYQAIKNCSNKRLLRSEKISETPEHHRVKELYQRCFDETTDENCKLEVEKFIITNDNLTAFFYAPEPDKSTTC
ncbi:MAG: hypothetical protein Q4P12_02870 [Bacteroidales bacterium]|nr:hypothetical protein [Bacteroidales bacterium]